MRLTVEEMATAIVMSGGGAREVALAARNNFGAIDSNRRCQKFSHPLSDDGEILLVSAIHADGTVLGNLTLPSGNSSTRTPSGSSPRRPRMRSGPRTSRPRALHARQVPVERLSAPVRRFCAGM